ncbi:YibE/F family protein [Halarsenatibacter silvermanii]|uniref:YibE/F family protein n=1 Tax=Halarsenatibacter silvermanii TaxID=321763 RepID=UPI0013566CCD
MANALILACVGGAIPLIFLLIAQEMSRLRIINMDFLISFTVQSSPAAFPRF